MPTKSKDFREQAERSIFIGERFTQDLLKRLTPEIIRIRLASADPITVYLDSPGGSTEVGDALKRLLKTPDQDGNSRRVITVATNKVASAAADLLIAGDYSMAYEHSCIHYHGTRITHDALTNEEAQQMAFALNAANAYFAERLTGIIIYNIAFLVRVFKADIEKATPRPSLSTFYQGAGRLATFLHHRLSQQNRTILKEVVDEIMEYQELATHLFKKLANMPDGPKKDFKTLKLIIDWKHKQLSRNGQTCTIDEYFLNRVQRSYNDFIRLDRRLFEGDFGRIYRTISPSLMDAENQKAYEAIPKENDEARKEFLRQHAFRLFYPIYLLVNSLSHRLQRGENELTATDAYWVGLINEVIGSNLPCMRDAVELAEAPQPELPLDGQAPTG